MGKAFSALEQLRAQPWTMQIEAAAEGVVSDDPKRVRNLKIFFISKYSGASLKTMGKRFDLGESGVSQVCHRIKKRKTGKAPCGRPIKKDRQEKQIVNSGDLPPDFSALYGSG